MEKLKKEKSKEHPQVTLNETKQFIMNLKDYVSYGTVSYTHASEKLGVKRTTKSFTHRISAAKQFGFISTASETIKFLPASKELVFPTPNFNEKRLNLECFKNPNLYKELITLYEGKAVPEVEALGNILVTSHGIAPNAKNNAAEMFRKTATDIGSLQNGVLNTEIAIENVDEQGFGEVKLEENGISEIMDSHVIETTMSKDVKLNQKIEGYENLEFPLGKQRKVLITIPSDINHKDLELIEGMVKLTLNHLINTNSEVKE
ncbi:hypothetical protein [Sedimentibacter sp.]|uniref:hypothetical protein n=1 Tax=Sedimentibacter sp. TaxID=1960295 RepID=UPI0028994916|nr:hypothetical protein [Sedimentibacter sp.]